MSPLAQLTLGPLTLSLWALVPILFVSVLIPLIIHLLSSVRAPQIHFSTLRFLKLSMEKTARRRRLQHWLLLVLRTILICLLLLAITQPLYKPRRGMLSGTSDTAAAIIIDNSLSMGATDGTRRRFDTARNLVKDLLRGAGKPAELSILYTNGREGRVTPALTHDLSAALRRMDAAELGLGAASISAVLGPAFHTLKASSLPNRAVYVVSDMQASTFANLAACKALRENPGVPLYLLNCGGADSSNLAVTDIQIKGLGRVAGATIILDATVLNCTTESRRAKVGIEIDGRRQDHLNQTILLTPGGTPQSRQKVSFEHVFTQPGFHSGRIFIEGANDILPADDSRDFIIQIADRIPVLVITGPGGAADPTGPGYYVMQALKVPQAITPVFHPLGEVRVEDIPRNDVVIACDVPKFDETLAAALRQTVLDGRTLILFVGPNVDPAAYNASLGAGDPPLLPATLGQPVGDPLSRRDPSKLLRVDMENPLFADLYDSQDKYPSILVFCHLSTALQPQHPGAALAWLDRDRPLLLERRIGRGRCLLWTTSANTVWTNLPTKPVFLPILVRMCLGAVGDAGRPGWVREGSQVVLAVPGQQPADLDVLLPADEAGRSATVRLQSKPDPSGNQATFAETFTRGVYSWQTTVQNRPTGQFLVAPDPEESDLRTIPALQITESLPDQPLCVASNLDELRASIQEASRGTPIWDYFLILVLVMATAEALFANRYRPAEVRVSTAAKS